MAINFNWSTRTWSIVQREISSAKLGKPLLTRSISHSAFSIHCTNLFFLRCSCVFTFLEIIKHNMPKMLLFFLPSSILKWLHKNWPILLSLFLNARWYGSCHIQSNKIVSNEVKGNYVLLESVFSYGKNWTNLLANPIVFRVELGIKVLPQIETSKLKAGTSNIHLRQKIKYTREFT